MSGAQFQMLLAGHAAGVSRTLRDHAVSGVVSTSAQTFSDVNLGPAGADRIVVAIILAFTSGSISSVTIGGVTADQEKLASNGSSRLAIYTANVPTGTSGDVVINVTSAGTRFSVQAYTIEGQSSATPDSTASSTASAPTATLNIPAGGVVIGGAVQFVGNSTSVIWSGITEDVDEVNGALNATSSASDEFPAADASLDVTATFNGTVSAQCGVWAVWGP